MQVGIPKEIKVQKSRVAITPLNISAGKLLYQAVGQAHAY